VHIGTISVFALHYAWIAHFVIPSCTMSFWQWPLSLEVLN